MLVVKETGSEENILVVGMTTLFQKWVGFGTNVVGIAGI